MPTVASWWQIKRVSDKLRIVASFLEHRRKILAIAPLLVVVSFVFVAAYFGHREPQMGQDEAQWFLGTETPPPGQVPPYVKYYRVVLESMIETYRPHTLHTDLGN